MACLSLSLKPLRLLSIERGPSRLVSGLKRGAIAPYRFGLIAFFSSLMMIGMGEGAIAEPIPDRGPGDLGTQVSPINDEFVIDGGQRRGINLFHSFENFVVDNGAVRFRPAGGIENVIGRVVSGDGSFINDVLGVDGRANLFLLDPNGIVFGENAQLDLRGSFIASTADEISFGDRGSFSAVDNRTPADNLRITPDALVFNQLVNRHDIPRIGDRTIRVERPNLEITPGLVVNNRRSLLLAGGPINLSGGILQAPEGQIEIAALGGDETVELPVEANRNGNRFQINQTEFSGNAFANVTLTEGALIDVTGEDQGDVTIYGQNIVLSNSSSICGGIGPGRACASERVLGIDEEQLNLLLEREIGDNNSRAGNIVLLATETVKISQGSQVINLIYPNSTAQSSVNSRDVFEGVLQNINTQNTLDLGLLFGSVVIGANKIVIDGELSNGFGTQINTSTFGTGNAGLILFTASENVNVTGDPTGANSGFISQILSTVGPNARGDGGGIFISTELLQLSNSAAITASTFGDGIPGTIDIFADDPTTSKHGDGSVLLSQRSLISSNIELGANGGVANDLSFFSNNVEPIISEIQTVEVGGITIRSGSVRLSDASQLQTLVRGSDLSKEGTRGDAGNISISTNNLHIDGFQATRDVDGLNVRFPSAIFSSVGENAVGDGGNIFVLSENVILDDGAVISSRSAGTAGLTIDSRGNEQVTRSSTGGTVFVFTTTFFLNDGSSIDIIAGSDMAEGGDALIFARGFFALNDASRIASSVGRSGEGGNIFVLGAFQALTGNSQISAPSSNVSLDGSFLLQDDSSSVTGETVTGSVFESLPNPAVKPTRFFTGVEELFVQSCPGLGQRSVGELGALYVTGRGGIPPGIRDAPNTNDIIAEWIRLPEDLTETSVRSSSRTVHEVPAPRSVEAQDLIQDANGNLWLIADANAARVPPVSPNGCPS